MTFIPAARTFSVMQTFLPYPSFTESARVLDYRRLGKQRVETWQIIRAMRGETKGWTNHPCTNMWRGHETALAAYGLAMCEEWKQRGYNDTMTERFLEIVAAEPNFDLPRWYGMKELHLSHKSNLIRKFPEFYSHLFPGVPADLEYVWPESDLRSMMIAGTV